MSLKISPLAPERFPDMTPVKGFRLGVAEAGVKYSARADVCVMVGQPGTQVAGVFTQNLCPGEAVTHSRRALTALEEGPRVCAVNSGNANVFTGQAGRDAVAACADAAAAIFGGGSDAVFLASTGVIGEDLPADKITAVYPKIDLDEAHWPEAARAIMTTDTYAKGATAAATVGGKTVRVNGIAKGSGMIAPDMATMLAFVATDAAIPQAALQDMLARQVGPSFNSVTVDSDTSTSDTLLLFATGAAGNDPDDDFADVERALGAVLMDLALQVVRDGEGATKQVAITVTGAVSDDSARRVGLSVANSPLVKTAIAGEDANWGRIVMAVGKAGEPAERDRLTVTLGGHVLATRGQPDPNYHEDLGAAHMKGEEIEIGIDLGMGEGRARVFTCDLTHGYIDINADYRS